MWQEVTGGHTSMTYLQPSQEDLFSKRGSIRGGPGNGGMFELGEAVVGEEVMPFRCLLVGNELAYITSKVCRSGAKMGVNPTSGKLVWRLCLQLDVKLSSKKEDGKKSRFATHLLSSKLSLFDRERVILLHKENCERKRIAQPLKLLLKLVTIISEIIK